MVLKVRLHAKRYLVITAFTALWLFHSPFRTLDETQVYFYRSVNKSMRASFMCGFGKFGLRTSSVGRKSCPYGGQEGHAALVRNITLEPEPEFAWSLVSTAASLTVISPWYSDLVLDVSGPWCWQREKKEMWCHKCVFFGLSNFKYQVNHATPDQSEKKLGIIPWALKWQ